MATAKKTPSGMWKVRAYSHTTPDGKKHYRAFTAPTKQEAEQKAARFSGTADRFSRCDLNVLEAVHGYIDAKAGVLSPSTIYAYRVMERNCFDAIGREKINRLSSAKVQRWISDLAAEKSAKYVRNIYTLLTSSVALYEPDIVFRVTLPAKQKKRSYAPSDDQIAALFNAAPDWLKICIALAAFGSLRRGEIRALKYKDVDGRVVHVHADMVRGSSPEEPWVYKEMPKTMDSCRDVLLPREVIDLIGSGDPDAYIIPDGTPNRITDTFMHLRNSVGLSGIRFHDLRHYYASISAALGIPQSYTERAGGWHTGSPIMREVYQQPIESYESAYAAKITGHFAGILKSMT
jgi:integrase